MMQEEGQRFERAVSAESPYDALVDLVRAMQVEGLGQSEIYGRFAVFLELLRANGRERDGDAVADVMDAIAGWCSTSARLFPGQVKV